MGGQVTPNTSSPKDLLRGDAKVANNYQRTKPLIAQVREALAARQDPAPRWQRWLSRT